MDTHFGGHLNFGPVFQKTFQPAAERLGVEVLPNKANSLEKPGRLSKHYDLGVWTSNARIGAGA